ncbi:hypothetical protein B0F90DRAFT_1824401 [Multifurca ochricompacta]|uniref:F-box domain-containing protein n=1 Tax=Multifurca ochricompacta TaxID=376703 RepID=A0AAD4QJ35_9AGAM|nr:hypothetical protein B0F90DRAFT_1824401 [Multifurca ochricompacta]
MIDLSCYGTGTAPYYGTVIPWRQLIFASSYYLNLRLDCGGRRSARKTLDCWPPLPLRISSEHLYPGGREEASAIAVLEQRDRVCEIALSVWTLSEKMYTLLQQPFPMLTLLFLSNMGHMRTLPNEFLGGSASRLHGLVELELRDMCHISPEVIVTSLSSLVKLSRFHLSFLSTVSRPDPISRHSPPLTRTILPALTRLSFEGFDEYLEDLIAQIDAPLLHILSIKFFYRSTFDIQQVSQFICRTEKFKSLNYGDLSFEIPWKGAEIKLDQRNLDHSRNALVLLGVVCNQIEQQVSAMAQICNKFTPFLSYVEVLDIDFRFRVRGQEPVTNSTEWFKLFRPFTSVEILSSSSMAGPYIASALKQIGLEPGSTMEIFPALRTLFFASSSVGVIV